MTGLLAKIQTMYRLSLAIGLAMTQVGVRPAMAQQITGRVFDQSRRVVEGVQVVVNRHDLRATTDSAGIFNLEFSASDSEIAFRRIGFEPLLLRTHPLPPADDTVLVQLRTAPIQLAEVTVLARATKPLRYAGTTKYDEVFLRQRVGFGTLVTREDIDRRFEFHTYELLEGVPGVSVWNGPPKRIRFARCQNPTGVSVFIDGMLQIPADYRPRSDNDEPVIEMLSRINPRDIEMIEVYRGASEIPAVFHWNGCAVIAIWTRWNK